MDKYIAKPHVPLSPKEKRRPETAGSAMDTLRSFRKALTRPASAIFHENDYKKKDKVNLIPLNKNFSIQKNTV